MATGTPASGSSRRSARDASARASSRTPSGRTTWKAWMLRSSDSIHSRCASTTSCGLARPSRTAAASSIAVRPTSGSVAVPAMASPQGSLVGATVSGGAMLASGRPAVKSRRTWGEASAQHRRPPSPHAAAMRPTGRSEKRQDAAQQASGDSDELGEKIRDHGSDHPPVMGAKRPVIGVSRYVRHEHFETFASLERKVGYPRAPGRPGPPCPGRRSQAASAGGPGDQAELGGADQALVARHDPDRVAEGARCQQRDLPLEHPTAVLAVAVLFERQDVDLAQLVGVVDPTAGDLDLDLLRFEIAKLDHRPHRQPGAQRRLLLPAG